MINFISSKGSKRTINSSRFWMALHLCFQITALPILAPSGAHSQDELPVLNDHLSGIISLQKEKEIGQLLLRQVRAQLPIISDPISNEYLQSLSYQLAEHSELKDKTLHTLLVMDSSINAFAMPGGVVAMNTGLFEKAENEDELSAVLAHELAHLSQRHFARMIAQQKSSQAATLGAYLASVLILLTVGAEPGLGAIAATQASAQQNYLSFSRNNEKEADRIGMQTLVNSERDPDAMRRFFVRLQQAGQYSGSKPPEYLLTHPVTETRIADAQNRSNLYPKKRHYDQLDYQLIRYRLGVIQALGSKSLKQYQKDLQDIVKRSSGLQKNGALYGLMLVYNEQKQFKDAEKILHQLLKEHPTRITFLLAKAEIMFEKEDYRSAKSALESALELHPGNYPLTMLYADTLIRNKQLGEAIYLLESLSISKAQEPHVWRRLAEAHGLKGNRLGIFRAKAEYFYLYGLNEQALEQLELALPLAQGNYQLTSKIGSRMEAIQTEETQLKL